MANNPAIAKGGTNSHEMTSTRQDDVPATSSISFTGCGRGRYRDAHTNKCVAGRRWALSRLSWRLLEFALIDHVAV
jgi:hypothetical protein